MDSQGEVMRDASQIVGDEVDLAVAAPLDQGDEPLADDSPALPARGRRHACEILLRLTPPVILLSADFL